MSNMKEKQHSYENKIKSPFENQTKKNTENLKESKTNLTSAV